MNFTEKNNYYYQYRLRNARYKQNAQDENEENINALNLKILDSILDDDQENFIEIISQSVYGSSPNNEFILTKYKLPEILKGKPSYASVCAFFGAVKCFNALSMLFSGGMESEEMKKTDIFLRSPLHFACAGGNLEIIRQLHQANFDFNARDCEECTPSCYAAMTGNLNVLEYLWMKGSEIIPKTTIYGSLNTLGVACLYGHLNIVKFINETIISSEEKEKNLRESLFSPRYNGDLTPLHLACQGGHADIVDYLLSMKDCLTNQINTFDYQQRTPIICACQNGSLNCIKSLVKTGKVSFHLHKKKRLPLIEASSCGHLDIVKYLIKLKEISIQDENSQHLNAIQVAILNKHQSIVQCLINSGALITYDSQKLGDLFLDACRTGDIGIIQILDKSCQIPYHKESGTVVSHWTIHTDLKLDEQTTWGDKYMQQACLLENDNLVSFLLSKGCNFRNVDLSSNVKGDWSSFMDFIVQKGANLNNCKNGNAPPIVSTIITGNLKRVMKMISMGAILTKEIISDYDLVLVACGKGKLDLFKFLMKYQPVIPKSDNCLKRCILGYSRENLRNNKKKMAVYYFMAEQILKTQNTDLNDESHDSSTQSPISLAASFYSIDMLQLLADYGANFTHCSLNFSKMTTSKHLPVYHFLEEHGCRFDRSISFGYLFSKKLNDSKSSPLNALLYNTQMKDFDIEILIFLLKYTEINDIYLFENNFGNIVDTVMKINSPRALLNVFQKVKKIILPKNTKTKDFLSWIKNSNEPELIDILKKYKI